MPRCTILLTHLRSKEEEGKSPHSRMYPAATFALAQSSKSPNGRPPMLSRDAVPSSFLTITTFPSPHSNLHRFPPSFCHLICFFFTGLNTSASFLPNRNLLHFAETLLYNASRYHTRTQHDCASHHFTSAALHVAPPYLHGAQPHSTVLAQRLTSPNTTTATPNYTAAALHRAITALCATKPEQHPSPPSITSP